MRSKCSKLFITFKCFNGLYVLYVQKVEETKLEPLGKPKKAVKKKKDDYDLPEIPDYERPVLEKYEQNDFDPSKKDKVRSSWCFLSQKKMTPICLKA